MWKNFFLPRAVGSKGGGYFFCARAARNPRVNPLPLCVYITRGAKTTDINLYLNILNTILYTPLSYLLRNSNMIIDST